MTLTEPELLASGPEAAPRRWPWVVAAALVALVLAGTWVDGRVRSAELDAIEARVAAAQTTLDQGDAHVAAMLSYGQPLLSRADLSPTLRADLEALVREAHAQAAVATAAARRDIDSVTVLPWHGKVAAAVAAYDDYLAAREATSLAAADDVRVGFAQHPEHDARLAVARSALAAAED